MNLFKLTDHLGQYHAIAFCGEENDDPVSEWISSAADWDANSQTYSDSENAVIKTSDEEQPDQYDPDFDTEFVPHLPPTTIRERHSDSSSDSSSGKSSNSKHRKKTRKNRDSDRNSAKN